MTAASSAFSSTLDTVSCSDFRHSIGFLVFCHYGSNLHHSEDKLLWGVFYMFVCYLIIPFVKCLSTISSISKLRCLRFSYWFIVFLYILDINFLLGIRIDNTFSKSVAWFQCNSVYQILFDGYWWLPKPRVLFSLVWTDRALLSTLGGLSVDLWSCLSLELSSFCCSELRPSVSSGLLNPELRLRDSRSSLGSAWAPPPHAVARKLSQGWDSYRHHLDCSFRRPLLSCLMLKISVLHILALFLVGE